MIPAVKALWKFLESLSRQKIFWWSIFRNTIDLISKKLICMFTSEFELRTLQIFLSVAEHKSIKRASSQLKISSPAISQAIRQLEGDLGAELFYRDVRPLRLTGAGRKLVREGTLLLEAAKSLKKRICTSDYIFDSLRLGIGESATSTIGPYLLSLLRTKVSDLSMDGLLTAHLVQKFLHDDIDVLISPEPLIDNDRLIRIEIYREDFLVVTKEKIETSIDVESLQRLASTKPFITYGNGSYDRISCDRYLRSLNIRPLDPIVCSSSYVITGLVHELDGWSLLTPTNALGGKTFLDNLHWATLPENKALKRSMWVVGDRVTREEQVLLVSKLAQKALVEKFFPHINMFAPGLAEFIQLVEVH